MEAWLTHHSQNIENTKWNSAKYRISGRQLCGQNQNEQFGMVFRRLATRPHKEPRCSETTDADKNWV